MFLIQGRAEVLTGLSNEKNLNFQIMIIGSEWTVWWKSKLFHIPHLYNTMLCKALWASLPNLVISEHVALVWVIENTIHSGIHVYVCTVATMHSTGHTANSIYE